MNPHASTMQLEFLKAILCLSAAAVISVVQNLAQTEFPDIAGIPGAIERLGLPVAFLVAAVAGLVALYKALLAQMQARLGDRDEFMKYMREDSERAEESRRHMTETMRELINEIRSQK